jgi:selenoprotein W-related protein
MASDILEKYGSAISGLTLIPSGGGVFEVSKDEKLVFSKKKLDRFPELEEIFDLIS